MNYGQPTAPPPYDGYGTNQPYPQYGPAPYPPPQVGFSQYGPPPPPGGYYPSQPPPQAYLPANAGQYGSAKVVQQPAPVV